MKGQFLTFLCVYTSVSVDDNPECASLLEDAGTPFPLHKLRMIGLCF